MHDHQGVERNGALAVGTNLQWVELNLAGLVAQGANWWHWTIGGGSDISRAMPSRAATGSYVQSCSPATPCSVTSENMACRRRPAHGSAGV